MRSISVAIAAVCLGVSVYAVSADARSSETPEVRRIRSHFDSVLVELAQRDIRDLTEVQRAGRARAVETLRRYRDRGVFPNNYDFPGQAVPYFVDRKTGTLCAVAHLLESTGRRDIVVRVARANNNVWVAELARDGALGSWLESNGLTLAEAARIQVPYAGVRLDPEPIVTPETPGVTSTKTSISTLTLGASTAVTLLNAWSNRDGHGRMRNVLGIASGVAGISMGAIGLSDAGANRSLGIANVALGTLSAYLSTRGVLRHQEVVSAERQAQKTRVTIAPTVSGTEGAGMAISLRF
jgi:hypothetical protein